MGWIVRHHDEWGLKSAVIDERAERNMEVWEKHGYRRVEKARKEVGWTNEERRRMDKEGRNSSKTQ